MRIASSATATIKPVRKFVDVRPKLPDYGTFTHWPDGGRALIHPDDMSVATRVVPSSRVFRRHKFDDVFYHYQYGPRLRFRIRPCMWLKLDWEGIDVGDQVEVRGLGMAREPFVARVIEMRFAKRTRRIQYTLNQAGTVRPRVYLADELVQLSTKTSLRTR
jgi:hypothetical protein